MLHPLITPKMLYAFGLICLSLLSFTNASFPYFGTKIGSLKRLHHGVSGDVYAVDSRTLFVKKFNYDGEAPAAYFYVGSNGKPSAVGGSRLRDERGGTASLTKRYRNKDITLTLPDGVTLKDIKWFSVWCDEFAVNFGDVTIPNNLDFPRPQKLGGLAGAHGVKSDAIVVVDAQTLLVPNFSYDGEAPDAKFWVGQGERPTPNGLRIPDENGKENPLRRYDHKTIVLTLPDDLTIFDIGHFGVWCEAFTVDFGHIRIPKTLNVPPSLKMLGISPQSKLNCEVLHDDLAYEVRWAMAGDSIVVQLVAKLEGNNYMAFGISPNKNRSIMIGSDAVVSWVEMATGKGYAIDYFISAKSQCAGGKGSCPDTAIEKNTNSVRLLNAAMVNGYSIVTYQRSLSATDKLDLPISRSGAQAIVWAIGPINDHNETSFHTYYNKHTHLIDFGRQPTWNCPTPEGSKPGPDSDGDEYDDESEREQGYPPSAKPVGGTGIPEEEFYDNNRAQALQSPNRRVEGNQQFNQRRPVATPKPVSSDNAAWEIPPIQCYEPEDGVFYAQMGPTGGKHGYSAITGHVGWGISWFINGLLIPEIHVVRGKTYTFVVEGGNNPDVPAKYHPFYITDDPVGGYEHKLEEEKKNIRIFAGVHRSRSGQVTPTGVGRLCNWTPDADGPQADEYQSFGAYQRTLSLKCDPGEPGFITWKPDRNTPDTVYYHCFTHRYLGWKIHVHDTCDDARYAASEKHAVRVPAPVRDGDDELEAEESIRHETKVSPNDNFLLQHQSDLIKNHNMNGTPPKLSFEITKSTEITKLISDGIRAAEALEDSILRQKNQQQHQQQAAAASGGVEGPTSHSNSGSTSPVANGNSASASPASSSSASSTQLGGPPQQQPFISTAAPETLHGETNLHTYLNSLSSSSTSQSSSLASSPSSAASSLSISKHQMTPAHHKHNPHLPYTHHYTVSHYVNSSNLPLSGPLKTIGLSEFLRPPFNAPVFHPVKLPGPRPYPGPLKKLPSSKPILPQHLPRHPPPPPPGSILPQPSVIVNHYRKPVPSLLRPFFKENPFPLQPMAASVLLLGQPTELGGHRKTDLHGGGSYLKKPIIPVPYGDLTPQGSLVFSKIHAADKSKLSNQHIKMPHSTATEQVKPFEIPLLLSTTTAASSEGLAPAGVFKNPFDTHEVEDEPSPAEIAAMKPAVNEGFKPDTVVVESGFKPILRHDGPMPPPEVVEQMANRREDPGLEIDEAMESDTLFLNSQVQQTQTQHFEPMFIPSPPDSTNATNVIIRKSSGLQLQTTPHNGGGNGHKEQLLNKPISSMLKSSSSAVAASSSDIPEVAKLRNATLEDILNEEDSNEVIDTEIKENLQNNIVEDKLETIHHKLTKSSGELQTEEKHNRVLSKEILSNDEDGYNIKEENDEDNPYHEHDHDGHEDQGPLKLQSQLQHKAEIIKATPSPTTSPKPLANKLKNYDNQHLDDIEMDSEELEIYAPQSEDKDLDDIFEMEDQQFDTEPEAQAAERIDTYYLPPDNQKAPPTTNIPTGSVVTYDGKSVVDSSLVLPPKLESEVDDDYSSGRSFARNPAGLSKLEQLIRNTPQYVPFRGEIPPLTPDISPVSVQQSVNKPLFPPPLSSPSASRPAGSTKLQIIHNNNNS